MPFDPDAYLASKEPAQGGFDPDSYLEKTAPKSVAGFAKNLGSDVVGLGKGLAKGASMLVDPLGVGESLIKGNVQPMMESPMRNLKTIGSIPGAIIDEGKRIGVGELLTGHPINAGNKFMQAAYDKPLTTALDVAPIVAPIGRAMGIGSKAAAGAGLAEEAGSMADDVAKAAGAADDGPWWGAEDWRKSTERIKAREAASNAPKPPTPELPVDDGPWMGAEDFKRVQARREAAQMLETPNRLESPGEPLPIAPEAQGILNKPPAPPPVPEGSVPTGATFQDTVANLKNKLPPEVKGPLGEVGEFVSQKYGQAAKQPGFADIAGDAMLRRAQGMRFRELGGTPGQARVLVDKMGEEGLRELMDVAKDKGITRSPLGSVRRQATDKLMEQSGRTIGGIREIAAKRGAVHNPQTIVGAIRSELDAEYLGKGGSSSQKGAYMKALEDIKAHATTPDALAKRITKMNQDAIKNKMTQPAGATTDVANAASRINNELIKSKLSPKEIELYENSLRDFGASKIFKKLHKFEIGREMGGRAGVGGLMRNIKQGAMDLGGSKVMENFYDKFGSRLKSSSGAGTTKSLASMGEGALEDLLSAMDDAIDEIGGGASTK